MALPTSALFSTARAARPTAVVPKKVPKYKAVAPALSIDDKAEFAQRRRDLTHTVGEAKLERDTGTKKNDALYAANYAAARGDRQRGQLSLNGRLASSGFADSAAFAVSGIQALTSQLETTRRQLKTDQTDQNAALEAMYQQSLRDRTYGNATIAAEEARRKQYNSMMQKIVGGSS